MTLISIVTRRTGLVFASASALLVALGPSAAVQADDLKFQDGAKPTAAAKAAPAVAPPTDGGPKRIQITGEIMDSWCQISGIMGIGLGSAHHQCAIWCAAGGGPIGIQGQDGTAYILLKVEDKDPIASQTAIEFETNEVKVDADWYVRDDVNYLIVHKILANNGIVNRNDQSFGIIPYGE
ncbi:MAG: hypothetical protein WDN69_28365 [Aliidongia sp.]